MANDNPVFISRVQKQHHSLVIVIPMTIRQLIEISAGDYAVFSIDPKSNDIQFSKFISKGKADGPDNTNPD
jgi:hypothetical protein